jgi:zinc protease
MKIFVMLLPIIFILLSCSHVENQKKLADKIHIKVDEVELKNGMKALIVNNSKLPIFSLYMFYKVGGKNEIPGITGASHFLEHMMFKGARKYGKNSIDFIIEGSGGATNAYTTNDSTVYYENLPSRELEKMLDIEADRMENLALDPEDFEKERAVVLEERKMRYENSPRGQLYQALMTHFYQGTPYATPVIGEIPDLKSVSREQIHSYFKKFYSPDNAVLVIVGDLEKEKTLEMIRKKFEHIPSSQSAKDAHESLTEDKFKINLTDHKIIHQKGDSPNPLFMMAFSTYKVGHPKSYGLDILSSIIGSGKSSSLTKDFVLTQKPLASSMYAVHQQLDKGGFFLIGGELFKGVDLTKFREMLLLRLRQYCENEISSRAVDKIKNNYLIDLYSGLDTNAGLAQFLGDRQTLFGDWKFYKKELELYESVTPSEVQERCHEVFNQKSLFVSVWEKNK